MAGPRVLCFALAGCVSATTAFPAAAQRPGPMVAGELRVCADPDNLPFSNQAGEGLENRLAELLAKKWDSKLEYIWWAAPRGQMRMLNGNYCDVMMQAPTEFDMAGVTGPYYRTSYVIVQRRDASHHITDLDDPALKGMKIGVHLFAADGENTPPAMALSAHGVVGLVGFSTTYAGGHDRPEDIVKAVADGTVDVAIVWGPIAGYHARKLGLDLVMTPVENDTLSRMQFAFSMGMATRRRERAMRDSLQAFIVANRAEIQNILAEFGIPTLPLPDAPTTGPAQ